MTVDLAASARPSVTVIGLGVMGLPIAKRLVDEFHVTAFDVNQSKRKEAERVGIQVATTPADAARDTSVVLVAVRTLEQVEQCLLGHNGVVGALKPEGVVVLMSTVGTEGARSLSDRLAVKRIELVDAPMSGSPARAAAGDLLVLVGASERGLERARPVLDHLASTLTIAGCRPGDGQSMKTVNQLLCGVHIAAAAEAIVLARALGLDLTATLGALGHGAADSFMLRTRGPRIIEALDRGNADFVSRLDIFVKDMKIVAGAADEAGLELPVSAAAGCLFRDADLSGLGAEDDATVTLALVPTKERSWK